MDEEQLKILWEAHAKNGGFNSYDEFKSLMNDQSARKAYFDHSNKDLGFKDFNEFETTLKKKDGGNATPTTGQNTKSAGVTPSTLNEGKDSQIPIVDLKDNTPESNFDLAQKYGQLREGVAKKCSRLW